MLGLVEGTAAALSLGEGLIGEFEAKKIRVPSDQSVFHYSTSARPAFHFSPRLVFSLPQYRRPSAALGIFSPRAHVKQDACVLEMPLLKTPR